MRCFIAINIPEEIKSKIAEATKNLTDSGLKKVEMKNLHLTLKFIGDVEEKKADEIKQILNKINFNKFDISLKNFGFFPNETFI
ncbi:MAG: RNA 2',3'-cyclic phosphodiesterase, partial [Candidatus Aenigmarchaeota archaeon]|nr:RNA 2',3'-cyclic phosphodiesterase [Candidatus Aenigmarchaeota archaeon]